jgi:hypothetical protein
MAALLVGGVPTASQAAAPAPESTANCYGGVSPSPTADEPDSLAYKFHCDSRITAYTLLVNRGTDYNTIDDFEVSPMTLKPDAITVDSTSTWSCEGYTPGNSFNCNTGGGTTFMGAWSYASGSFDPTGPYCKYLPTGAKPGTPAVAQAVVQLVVSDVSGAEDGPFRLYYMGKCHPSPDSVPLKTAKNAKHAKKGSK